MYKRPPPNEPLTPGMIVAWMLAALVVAFIIYHGYTHKQVSTQHSANKV